MEYKKESKKNKKSQDETIIDWLETQLKDSNDSTSAYSHKQERY